MRVHVEVDPREGAYRVWAWISVRGEDYVYEYGPVGGGVCGLRWDEGRPLASGASLRDVPPTLVLPYEIVEALIAADDPTLNPRNAGAEHLKDARAVRDRLLSLVERMTQNCDPNGPIV